MDAVNVAIGIILKDGKVLTSHRPANGHLGDCWEFPGGKLEQAESAAECLHREVQEELGIRVRIVGRLAPITHQYPDLKVCLHPFLATIENGEPRPLAARELRWATPAELPLLPFPEANVQLIRDLPGILRSLGL
jgi:mutator protein MutT